MNITDPRFKYTHSRDMGPDYLAKKFKRIQRELDEKKRQQAKTVTPLQRKVAK